MRGIMNHLYRKIIICFFIIAFVERTTPLYAQPCSSAVSSFPYTEGFENSDGNWIPGGTLSDWAWGTPAKALIDVAAEGNKCWLTGGLTGSYTANENSWLQSPCFDFTNLVTPYISMKVYWETERKFDGAALQYSINEGATWSPVGTINSNANCLGQNWYNTPSVTYLSGTAGWSGTILPDNGSCLGGSGSGGWITARHEISTLAGKPKVQFRFVFGAGSTCNGFDGFAVDFIVIEEAPLPAASFTYACKPGKIVDFVNTTQCAFGSVWNFGDAGSGAANSSTQKNSTHQFSSAGTYNVTLVSSNAIGATVTLTQQIIVLGVNVNIDQPIKCNGDANAVLSVSASGSTAAYAYLWNTNPAQTTAVINNVAAGNYSVTVSSGIACTTTADIILAAPEKINGTFTKEDIKCSASNGSITAAVTGGTAPYSYLWSTGANTASVNQLPAGVYNLQVTDANQCTGSISNIIITDITESIPVSLGRDTVICPGEILLLNPGSFTNYLWQDNSTGATFKVTKTGTYTVNISNGTGCMGSDTIKVLVDCSGIFFPSAFTPNNDNENDFFGPLGNFSFVTEFRLVVYNRYGQLVFVSNNPSKKWDGSVKTIKTDTGTFVWMAEYFLSGKKELRKGTVMVIR